MHNRSVYKGLLTRKLTINYETLLWELPDLEAWNSTSSCVLNSLPQSSHWIDFATGFSETSILLGLTSDAPELFEPSTFSSLATESVSSSSSSWPINHSVIVCKSLLPVFWSASSLKDEVRKKIDCRTLLTPFVY